MNYGYDAISVKVNGVEAAFSGKSNVLTINHTYLNPWNGVVPSYTITAVGIKGNKSSVPATFTVNCFSDVKDDKIRTREDIHNEIWSEVEKELQKN